jgi:hypothetical protein
MPAQLGSRCGIDCAAEPGGQTNDAADRSETSQGLDRHCRAVQQRPELNRQGDQPRIVEGAVINLNGPAGPEPVKVTKVTDTSFSFMSLPGHHEGAGCVIEFSIVSAAASPVPGRLNWELRVEASGPLSGLSVPRTHLRRSDGLADEGTSAALSKDQQALHCTGGFVGASFAGGRKRLLPDGISQLTGRDSQSWIPPVLLR